MAVCKSIGPAVVLLILGACLPLVEPAQIWYLDPEIKCSMNDDCDPATSCHVASDLHCCPKLMVHVHIAVDPLNNTQRLLNCTCNRLTESSFGEVGEGMKCTHIVDPPTSENAATDALEAQTNTSTTLQPTTTTLQPTTTTTAYVLCRDDCNATVDLGRLCPKSNTPYYYCCPNKRYSLTHVQHSAGFDSTCQCDLKHNEETTCIYYTATPADPSSATSVVSLRSMMIAVWLSSVVF